jgi:hypothetical protein
MAARMHARSVLVMAVRFDAISTVQLCLLLTTTLTDTHLAPPPASLQDLLDALDFNQVVIFVKNVQRAKALNQLLNQCNFPSQTLYGGMKQEERLRVGGTQLLVIMLCCWRRHSPVPARTMATAVMMHVLSLVHATWLPASLPAPTRPDHLLCPADTPALPPSLPHPGVQGLQGEQVPHPGGH